MRERSKRDFWNRKTNRAEAQSIFGLRFGVVGFSGGGTCGLSRFAFALIARRFPAPGPHYALIDQTASATRRPPAWYALQRVLRAIEGAWTQLETPNDITLKADDAELARTTLLSAKGATCAAAGAPRLRVDKHVVPRRRATRDCCKVERWPQHLNNPPP